ncbi:MAG TPA: hypothetical protein VL329_10095 [Nitrospiraceae bacterium]|jgi:hypothetical protein|nr:hypothetical protein [Nitrospiraceae bacterium]
MSVKTFLAEKSERAAASGGSIEAETVQFEPIIEDGMYHGMLVQSALERVALFSWKRMILTLTDISHFRQALTRFQARRAVLYVSADLHIPSSFILLATLSKIAIVREEPVCM